MTDAVVVLCTAAAPLLSTNRAVANTIALLGPVTVQLYVEPTVPEQVGVTAVPFTVTSTQVIPTTELVGGGVAVVGLPWKVPDVAVQLVPTLAVTAYVNVRAVVLLANVSVQLVVLMLVHAAAAAPPSRETV